MNTTNQNQTNFIDPVQFVDQDVFKLIGLENAPKEKKDKIMADMVETIKNRILARILDLLDENGVKEFETICAANDKQKTEEFLNNHGINIIKISTEEAMVYKMEMINLMGKKD